MLLETLSDLNAARETNRSCCLLTEIPGGAQRLVFGDDRAAGDNVSDLEWEACVQALRDDRSQMFEHRAGRQFIQAFNPPLRMLVVGAVHITQALAPMAQIAGYEVTGIDPRRAFANDARFPGVTVETDWPDEVLERLGVNHRTAVVTLTHDPKLDDPALEVALRSNAFYIGSLGSRRTHAARLERLRQAGFDEGALGRIQGPLGLPLGSKSPAEIAISAIAQITQILRMTS